MKSKCIVLTCFFLMGWSFAFAGENDSQKSPRFVVNLLDYVAADYSGAVQNGKIISKSEYAEQLEFVDSALQTASGLPETKDIKSLHDKIATLKSLIQGRAPADAVAKQAQLAKQEVIEITKMELAPQSWPNLKNGAELFAKNCASCHGLSGHGDGVAGRTFDPKPADFHSKKMNELSAFKAYNVIRSGVPGTGMPAWNQFSDKEAWDLSFYVLSFRHGELQSSNSLLPEEVTLETASVLSDGELFKKLSGSDLEKTKKLNVIRTYSARDNSPSSLNVARANLLEAQKKFDLGLFSEAKTSALKAYLEGIEPVEPRLRANDPEFVSELESKMAFVRSTIESRKSSSDLKIAVDDAMKEIRQAEILLTQKETSPWLTFMIAAGILLREGFEAVLILIALLAVVKASGSKPAQAWVHGGWIVALGIGALAWVFSGWLMVMSGAQRELMEAVTSILAVIVLLFMGFWLHSKTEIHRWNQFINVKVKGALEGSNLFGLALISFMAVFREAFETVLFLRAVWLEGGDVSKVAMAFGVFGALAFIFLCSWMLLKYSTRLPIKKVFGVSSVLMIILAIILAGKGVHSLQETGLAGVTGLPIHFRAEVVGFFPTRETLLVQVATFLTAFMLWQYGQRAPRTE